MGLVVIAVVSLENEASMSRNMPAILASIFAASAASHTASAAATRSFVFRRGR